MSTILAWILGHFIATFHVLKSQLDCPGGALIFSHMYVRLDHCFGFKILSFNFFWGGGGFRTMNIFWGMKLLWIFFWGRGSLLCIFGFFLEVNVQSGDFLGGS